MSQLKGLSVYKYKRLAEESLKNAIRLQADAMLLYKMGSFPSSFHLAVLAIEEFAKAKWIDHVYHAAVTNEGFGDPGFEQKWLLLLYSHTEKQYAFVAREEFDFSPRLVRFIKGKNLERKKQQAIYVGLEKVGNRIDTSSRISKPSRIKASDARQVISLLNQELVDVFGLIEENEGYFGIEALDALVYPDLHDMLSAWPHRSGLKSRGRFLKQHTTQSRDGK
jgi:AbiV family abortive infection protein